MATKMKKIQSFMIALYFISSCRTASAFTETSMSNEYMICRPVAGIFGTLAGGKNSTEKGIMPVLQGPVGAPGSYGKTGLPGPRGEPNYDKVSHIVEGKVNSINARLFKLENEIAVLKAGGGGGVVDSSSTGWVPPTSSPGDEENGKDCMDKFDSPMNVEKTCYKVIGGEGLLWTFEAAESNCTKLGGNLADLNSRTVYDRIYNYVDKTYSTVVQAWTGMRYEDNKLKLRGGEEATYAKWSSGYPRKSTTSYYASYNYVYIYMDTSAYIRRLSNTRSSTKRAYAICSFDMMANSTTTEPNTIATTVKP